MRSLRNAGEEEEEEGEISVGGGVFVLLIRLLRQQAPGPFGDALRLSGVDVRLGELASLSITSSRVPPAHQRNLQRDRREFAVGSPLTAC